MKRTMLWVEGFRCRPLKGPNVAWCGPASEWTLTQALVAEPRVTSQTPAAAALLCNFAQGKVPLKGPLTCREGAFGAIKVGRMGGNEPHLRRLRRNSFPPLSKSP